MDVPKIQESYNLMTNSQDLLQDDAYSLQLRTTVVQWLEEKTGYEFGDTKDFQKRVKNFIANKRHGGEELREIRKKKGWSQLMLANYLGISERTLRGIEQNYKPLNLKALELIEEMEGV